MKAARIVIALAAAISPSMEVGAVHQYDVKTLERGLTPAEQRARELAHVKVEFDECVGQHIDWCRERIWAEHKNTPQNFGNMPTMQIEQAKPIKPNEGEYYMVGMRTNMEGTAVVGLLGEQGGEALGMIWYPFQWVLPAGTYADKTYDEPTGIDIGPWDCDVGSPLTPEQCCTLIKSSMPYPDVNNNKLDCYSNYPIGSSQNPVQENRVIILTNHQDIVQRAPVNE